MDVLAQKLVEIPYVSGGRSREGADCYGLVRLFYGMRGVELPRFDGLYANAADREVVHSVIEGSRGDWVSVYPPQAGDVVRLWISRPSRPTHLGIWLEGHRMLNVRKGCDAVIEPLGRGFWKDRVDSYWRLAA